MTVIPNVRPRLKNGLYPSQNPIKTEQGTLSKKYILSMFYSFKMCKSLKISWYTDCVCLKESHTFIL